MPVSRRYSYPAPEEGSTPGGTHRGGRTEHHGPAPEDVRGDPVNLEAALGAAIAQRVQGVAAAARVDGRASSRRSCGISKGMLSKIENAQASPEPGHSGPLSDALQVPVTAFFRGLNEEQDVLYVKAGKGPDDRAQMVRRRAPLPVPRRHAGAQQRPRAGARHPDRAERHRSRSTSTPGTELIYMLAGRMEYGYGSARYLLGSGDALQFIGGVPHGPVALRRAAGPVPVAEVDHAVGLRRLHMSTDSGHGFIRRSYAPVLA